MSSPRRVLLTLGSVLTLVLCSTALILDGSLLSASSYSTSDANAASTLGDAVIDAPLPVSHLQSPTDPRMTSFSVPGAITEDTALASTRQPDTPPGSLPSDPYAYYIYQRTLEIPKYHFYNDVTQSTDEMDQSTDPEEVLNQTRLSIRRKRAEARGRRTLIIGDVHGHLVGLNRFLRRAQFDSRRDIVVLAGDIIAKGNQSLAVIDRARAIGAKCVRGNHDDKVIRWRGFLDSLSEPQLEALEQHDFDYEQDEALLRHLNDEQIKLEDEQSIPDDVVLDFEGLENLEDTGLDGAIDFEGGDVNSDPQIMKKHRKHKGTKREKLRVPSDLDRKSEHYRIAKSLSRAQYKYLLDCPLILTLPHQLSVHNVPIHVVHAGIDPLKHIQRQNPWVLENVRNILKDGTPSRKKDKGQAWTTVFNRLHNKRSPAKRDFLMVYGHDAGRALNINRWSIGLDTGCVYGRLLSGYVAETGEVISSPCPVGF